MTKIFLFTEGSFEIAIQMPTLEEARAYARGAEIGASYYAGSLAAYVMPEAEAELREREEPEEVERAFAASVQ